MLEKVGLFPPDKGMFNERLVYFFDPPWGGLDYKSKESMLLFEDFEPYPMRYALTRAFTETRNVILKLPKNTGKEQLIYDITQAYSDATFGEQHCGDLHIQIVKVSEGDFPKFYLVLVG